MSATRTIHNTTTRKLTELARCPKQYELVYRKRDPRASAPTKAEKVSRLVLGAIQHVSRARAGRLPRTSVRREELLSALEGNRLDTGTLLAKLDPAVLSETREALTEAARTLDLGSLKLEHGEPYLDEPWILDCGEDVVVGGAWERIDERADGAIVLVEHTTDGEIRTQDELRLDPAATVSLAAAHMRWPERRVRLERRYLKKRALVELEWSEPLDAWARAVTRAHVQARRRFEALLSFPATTGPHCSACPFRETCREHKDAIETRALPDLDDRATLEALVKELARAHEGQKLLKARVRDLSALARAKLSDERAIYAGGYKARLAKRRVPRFPDFRLTLERLEQIFGLPVEYLESKVVGIKKEALAKLLSALPAEVREWAVPEVEKTGTLDVATWVEVRKLADPFAPAAQESKDKEEREVTCE